MSEDTKFISETPVVPPSCPTGCSAHGGREGFYEKMWKDFVSLQRGSVEKICVDAERWRSFAESPQTALMLGSELDPNSQQDWLAECNRLVDARKPNTVLSKTGN